MTVHSGGCLCGAVRFDASDVETEHMACHCEMCRRWNGSPNMAAKVGDINFQGEENIATYTSSEWAKRGFCKTCGSNLFYLLKPTGDYYVSTGSFDDSTPFRLVREVFIDRKPDGYAFAGDLPGVTEAQVMEMFASMGDEQ